MAGVKGRSGRRPGGWEDLRRRVVQKSWEIIEKQLNDENVSPLIKREIALKIVPKDIPTEFSGSFTAQVVAMGTIQKLSPSGILTETLEFKIGGNPKPSEDT